MRKSIEQSQQQRMKELQSYREQIEEANRSEQNHRKKIRDLGDRLDKCKIETNRKNEARQAKSKPTTDGGNGQDVLSQRHTDGKVLIASMGSQGLGGRWAPKHWAT